MKTKIVIAISTLLLFFGAAALGQCYGKDHEGKPHLLLCKAKAPKHRFHHVRQGGSRPRAEKRDRKIVSIE